MDRRRFTGVLLAFTGGLITALSGCGGGGSERIPQGNDAVRALTIGAHQAFAAGSAYPLAAIQLAAPTDSQFTTRAIALGRAVPSGIVLDPVLLAYKKYTIVGNTVNISYYSNSGGTNEIGSAAVVQPGGGNFSNDYAAYPATVNFNANTNTSVLPFTGNGSVVFTDASGANTLTGRFTSRRNNTTLEGTMTLDSAGSVTGAMTMTQGGTTTRFTNVAGPLTGDLSGDVACEPYGWTGRATFNLFTGNFSITLNTDTGTATAARDGVGSLVIQFADGTSQTIQTPLSALLNGSAIGSTPTPTPTPTPSPTPMPTDGDYAITEIGPTGAELQFYGRNTSGQSIASQSGATPARGYIFAADGTRTQIPNLENFNGNIPSAISDDGKIVGTCYSATEQGYLYDSVTGVITALPSFRRALGINNVGKIVGVDASLNPLIYDIPTGTATPLTNVTQFTPYAINDNNVIVGASSTGSAQRGGVYKLSDNTFTQIPLAGIQTNNPAFEITPNGLVGGASWSSTSDEAPYIYNIETSVTTQVTGGQGNVYVPGTMPVTLAVSLDGKIASLDNQTGYLYYNGLNQTFATAIGTINTATWTVKYPIGFGADGSLLAQALKRPELTWQLIKLTPV